jgi:inorganic pyrophosphatase
LSEALIIDARPHAVLCLPAFTPSGLCRVVVETPRGSRHKYKFEPELGVMRLKSTLPLGMAFPYEFGFIPGTKGDDGDPLDALLVLSEPATPGCLVEARLLGVVKVMQNRRRNDRLILAWPKDPVHGAYRQWTDLPKEMRDDIERFFHVYPTEQGKAVHVQGHAGSEAARKIVAKGARRFAKE